MKKVFRALISTGVLSLACAVSAQDVVLQDFESGTDGSNLAGNWLPSFSGTSTGNLVPGSDSATYSSEQAHSGTLSGKLAWTWQEPSGATKRIRIQPAAAGWIAGTNNAVDRSATPFVGFYLYGAAQGDQVALYMGEGDNGASPYEQFTPTSITWNGWELYERHIVNDPVTSFATGDGVLPVTNSVSGLFFFPPTENPTTTEAVTYYVDDFAYTAATRADADVSNWSVY